MQLARSFAFALFLSLIAPRAGAVIIDFEALPFGSLPTYSESGVLFTTHPTEGPLVVVNVGGGRGLTQNFIGGVMRADIAGGASSVSVLLKDASPDLDFLSLEAYDAADVQVDVDIRQSVDASIAQTLTVSGAYIAWVAIGTNSAATDVFTYAPAIPEPQTFALLLAGLALLGFAARRKTGTYPL